MLCFRTAWRVQTALSRSLWPMAYLRSPWESPSRMQRPTCLPPTALLPGLQGRERPARTSSHGEPCPRCRPLHSQTERPDSSPRMFLSKITTYFSLLKTIWWLPAPFKVKPTALPSPRPQEATCRGMEPGSLHSAGSRGPCPREGVSKDRKDPVWGDPVGEGRGNGDSTGCVLVIFV